MSDAEKLAAVVRVLDEMAYLTVEACPRDGTRWVVIDGSGHVNADDAAVLAELVGIKLGKGRES